MNIVEYVAAKQPDTFPHKMVETKTDTQGEKFLWVARGQMNAGVALLVVLIICLLILGITNFEGDNM